MFLKLKQQAQNEIEAKPVVINSEYITTYEPDWRNSKNTRVYLNHPNVAAITVLHDIASIDRCLIHEHGMMEPK